MGRFVSIWFRYLETDRFVARYPELTKVPFVLAAKERGRVVVAASSPMAMAAGIRPGMVVADARAVLPSLKVLDRKPELPAKLLAALAEWCIKYSPEIAIDLPDGLLMDASGCSHLWGGERLYLLDIVNRLRERGYDTRIAIADTVGTAWAVARFGKDSPIVTPCSQMQALLQLPPAALRLEDATLGRMDKLGLKKIGSFISMPRPSLRRRFGEQLLCRLDQALGMLPEPLELIKPKEPFEERLPCLEPIRTRKAIEIAVHKLLEQLCKRLEKEGKGLRSCVLKGYRLDGNIQQVSIGTNRPTRNVQHLYKLLDLKLEDIEPDLGIELFLLEAPVVEPLSADSEKLWNLGSAADNVQVAELLDRLAIKIGPACIHRYMPAKHHWPERSYKPALSIDEKPAIKWRVDLPRPIHLLPEPVPIQVTVALPDYPPIQFLYKGELHKIRKADGPERIEPEWWLQDGRHRDYYALEDQQGRRYWIFRLGHYDNEDQEPEWFLHGFYA